MLHGNSFGWRENVIRHICASAWAVTILSMTFFTPRAFAASKIFSPDAERVNLYKTLNFETYKATGTEEEREATEERLALVKPAAFFLEGAQKIEERITVLVIGMMFCPDCKAVYPYVEAMKAANPFISVRYLERSAPGAREFMLSRTGRANVPMIFGVRPDGTKGNRDGKIWGKSYTETPERVTGLLQAAKTERERSTVWKDFHAGVYDEDIQRDLLDLILQAD